MGEIYLKVLLIMVVFSAFAVPGFALKKLKMIGEGGTLTLSNILLAGARNKSVLRVLERGLGNYSIGGYGNVT